MTGPQFSPTKCENNGSTSIAELNNCRISAGIWLDGERKRHTMDCNTLLRLWQVLYSHVFLLMYYIFGFWWKVKYYHYVNGKAVVEPAPARRSPDGKWTEGVTFCHFALLCCCRRAAGGFHSGPNQTENESAGAKPNNKFHLFSRREQNSGTDIQVNFDRDINKLPHLSSEPRNTLSKNKAGAP